MASKTSSVKTSGAKKSAARRPSRREQPLGRQAWLEAARRALIEEGTAGVEVNKLAKRLGVSRGGFYWFFKSRQQLLERLIAYWAETSHELFERLPKSSAGDGLEEFRQLNRLWVDETQYDPKWDGAVRDWARTSAEVRAVVEAVDEKRIGVIEKIFVHLGFTGMDAHIRARVTYYHQVGYYALGVRESRKRRLELLPYYIRALTGGREGR